MIDRGLEMTESGTETAAERQAQANAESGRLMRRASYASVSVALFLIVLKFAAWIATDSVSMLSTLIDSLLDLAASLLSLFAIRQSLMPADREHRFGHGKAEPLGALGQSAFIAGSSVLLLFEATQRCLDPQNVPTAGAGIVVMIISILATLALIAFQRMVIARTGSVAVSADSTHYLSDLLVNGGVIAALAANLYLGWLIADPLIGTAIALFILATAWRIVRRALDMLMDRELGDSERQRIRAMVTSHPQVRAIHELKTRAAGRTAFIQFHLEMDPEITLLQAHQIADEVEDALLEAFPGAEILIHEDPAGVVERRRRFA